MQSYFYQIALALCWSSNQFATAFDLLIQAFSCLLTTYSIHPTSPAHGGFIIINSPRPSPIHSTSHAGNLRNALALNVRPRLFSFVSNRTGFDQSGWSGPIDHFRPILWIFSEQIPGDLAIFTLAPKLFNCNNVLFILS